MADKIEKNDLLAQEAIEAFEELTKNLIKAEKGLEEVAKAGGKLKEGISQSKTITELNNSLLTASANTKKLAEEQLKLKKVNKDLASENKKLADSAKKLSDAEKKQQAQSEKSTKTKKKKINVIKSLSRSLRGLIGTYIGLTAVMRTFRAVFDTTKEIDSLHFAMKNIITDTREYAESQAFLNRIVASYGLELFDATRSYVKFRAAIGATNLSVHEGRKVFESFAKTGAVLGLRADELNGVFLALEQMLSKGKVTTEELRRQLGERIPGAFNIMANAIGVSVTKLDDMLRKGEVLSEDALPKLAAEMEKTFGIETVEKVNTLVAAQERVRTTWRDFIKDLEASEEFRIALDAINVALVSMLQNLGRLLPSAEKGIEKSQERISRIRAESATAADELVKLTNSAGEMEKSLEDMGAQVEQIFINIKKEAGGMSDAEVVERMMPKEKLLLASYKDLEAQHKEFVNAINKNWERGYLEQLTLHEKSTDDLEEMLKVQEDNSNALNSRKYELYLQAIKDELAARKKAEDEAALIDEKGWVERFNIFKAQQDAQFAEAKQHQEIMRAQKERAMRDGGATEVEMDRATASHKIEQEKSLTEFRLKQLKERENKAKGHATQETAAVRDAANVQAALQKKLTDFQISEGEKEHALYMERMREKQQAVADTKDAELLAIEQRLIKQLEGLQLFATAQARFADTSLKGELIDSKLNIESLKVTVEAIEDMLEVENLTAQEIEAIEKRLFQAKKAMQEAERAELEKTFERRKELTDKAVELGIQAVHDTFDVFKMFQDAKADKLQWTYDREIALAGDSVSRKIFAENKYAEEKRKLQRRQAITDKAQAAFNVIIDTYKGIASALAGAPLTLPLIPFIKAIGAINLAAVLSTPLPSFEKGGHHEGGPARFSEGGKRELFIPDSGKPYLTPGTETIANMPAGTFIPSDETQKMLANAAMNNFVNEVSAVDMSTTNGYLRQMATKKQTNYSNGFKITNKSNIFGRYATRY